MARRITRPDPFAEKGGSGTASTAPDPLADFGGGPAPDPLADFGDAPASNPAVAVTGGLDALAQNLQNGSSPLPVGLLTEIKQSVDQAVLMLGTTAVSTEMKTLSDLCVARFQLQEAKAMETTKQLEAVYKLLASLPASITEGMAKWFDESLSKFVVAAGNNGVIAPGENFQLADQASKDAKAAAAAAKAAKQAGPNPVHANILAAVLPMLRERKAAQPNFRLSYQSKGPAVWAALVQVAGNAGLTVDASTVEAAFTESGRLGDDDISLK